MDIKELNEFMRDHGFCNTNNEDDLPKKYVCDLVESAMKDGYTKAINEFTERLEDSLIHNYRHLLRVDTDGFEWLTTDAVGTHINEIAEEMRGGE